MAYFSQLEHKMKIITISVSPIGLDERLRDGLRGRRSILPRVERDGVRGQCGERPSLDEAVGADDAAEHPGNQEPARDPLGQGEHLRVNAGSYPIIELHI